VMSGGVGFAAEVTSAAEFSAAVAADYFRIDPLADALRAAAVSTPSNDVTGKTDRMALRPRCARPALIAA
jgi:hypothetical protein